MQNPQVSRHRSFKRLHELVPKHLGRKSLLAQGRSMGPRLQAVFTVDRRGEALAPVMTWEVRRYILDGVRMDQIGIGAGVICKPRIRSVISTSLNSRSNLYSHDKDTKISRNRGKEN